MATTKISRAELDAVLNRTSSGTRPVVRHPQVKGPPSVPDLDAEWPGPRDDAPQITIRKIESVEIDIQGNPLLEAVPSLRERISPVPSLLQSQSPSPSPLVPVVPTVHSPVREFSPLERPITEPLAQQLRAPERAPRRGRALVTVLLVLIVLGALTATFLAGRLSMFVRL